MTIMMDWSFFLFLILFERNGATASPCGDGGGPYQLAPGLASPLSPLSLSFLLTFYHLFWDISSR